MKGNINPFSGDKQYQTDFWLRFKICRIEEAYSHDLLLRHRYCLIFLCLFSLFLMILSYFSSACHISSQDTDCSHQALLILNLLSLFFSMWTCSKDQERFNPWIFTINGLYSGVKALEEFEGRVVFLLITGQMTVYCYFLMPNWRKVFLFDLIGYFLLYGYLRMRDFLLLEIIYQNWLFVAITIAGSVLLLFLKEKASKEQWVMFDSFKKSERMFEFLIDELNFPIFLVDQRKNILLHNSQALNLLQQSTGKPVRNFRSSKIGKAKIQAGTRSFSELFNSRGNGSFEVAHTLLNMVLSGGKRYSCGLLKLSLTIKEFGSNQEMNFGENEGAEDISQNIQDEMIFEMIAQEFIWKGIKCALVGLKEEKNLLINNLFSESMINQSLETLMSLIYSHSLEEQCYYDSLLQNTAFMETNKLLYNQLYKCHSQLFFSTLMKNFLLNNFEHITLDPESVFFRIFNPPEIFSNLQHILQKKTEKNEVIFEILPSDSDSSFPKFEKNFSNFSRGISNDSASEKHERGPSIDKVFGHNKSQDNEKILGPLFGPCYMIQHILIILIKSVIKLKLCKRITISYKLEKDEASSSSNSENKLEDLMLFNIDLAFEEFLEDRRKSIPNNNNMLVGDFLSSTNFKDQKKVKEFLTDLMTPEKSFIEADREASFIYLRGKNPRDIGIFFLPFMLNAMDSKYKIIHEEEFNKNSTKFIFSTPVKVKNIQEIPENQRKKNAFAMNGTNGISFEQKRMEIMKSEEQLRTKPILQLNNQVFTLDFCFKNNPDPEAIKKSFPERKEETKEDLCFIRKSNSREFKKEEFKINNKPSNNNIKINSMKVSPPPELLMKKHEVYIEEELKKYLHHLQNGFSVTVEHILNAVLNEESTKGAHIIFPPKSTLFSEKKNLEEKPLINLDKKHQPLGLNSRRPQVVVRNIAFNKKPNGNLHEDKEDVSSFLFTESNRTESLLTGKSNDDEMLNDSLEDNSGSHQVAKESPKTLSNQLRPRTILRNEVKGGMMFRSPNLLRSKVEEKHVLVRGESLIKYLKNSTILQTESPQKEQKMQEKKLDLNTLREKNINNEKMSLSRISNKFKMKQKRDIRRLTYTRRWMYCEIKEEMKVVTEMNCAVYNEKDIEPPSFEMMMNRAEIEKKIFIRKPNKRPKSIVSDNPECESKGRKHKPKNKASVLNNIKELTKMDNLHKFEEIKQEEDSPKKKPKHQYEDILKNLEFKDRITILAYDSESHLNDPIKCKGVKSLALKIGHDYKFDLCSSGRHIIEHFKSFILRSNVYHIIIVELEMRQMAGWKCVKKIRHFEEKYKPKHRSFICGLLNEDERDYEVYVHWGLDEFLKKPFDTILFEEIVKRRMEEIKKMQEKEVKKEEETTMVSNESIWFKELIKPMIEDAKNATYQNDPIMMLAIDDNYFILMGISNLKLNVKYKMQIANSGKQGLEKYKKTLSERKLFHIIFIDIEMPEMDGIEVTRIIRAIEKEFKIPRAFICGLITDENNKFDVYHEEGMDEFLKKPVNVHVLNEMLERRIAQINKAIEKVEDPLNLQAAVDLQNNEPLKKVEEIKNLLEFEPILPLKFREKNTFLTIDDNDFILLGISHLKLDCEYKMEICKSGVVGLTKYKDFLKNGQKFHAIFLDIDMPEMNGLEVSTQIRQIEKQYNLPHVFICGLITEDNKDFDTYIEAGMNDFLKKPVNPKSMNLLLQKILPLTHEENQKSTVPIPKSASKIFEQSKKEDIVAKNGELKLAFKPEVTFLTVDDNDFILLGISHLKLDFKYKMDISKNGSLALEKYKKMREEGFLYHTIFMDIDMPVMNGLECASKIRELEKGQKKGTYIIGLINDDYKDVEKYMEAGMNEFLNKPVNPKSMNIIMKKRLEEIEKMEFIPKKPEEKKAEEEKKNGGKIEKKIIRCKEECTLLAVDDNDFILMGISHLRVDVKYKMDICKSGKLALDKYYKLLDSSNIYHLIFMDIEMPLMNGLECTRKIRDFENGFKIPRTPIIGLINEDNKDIERYLEAGMDEFINKPVNPHAFEAIIKKRLIELTPKPEILAVNIQKDEETQKLKDNEASISKKVLAYPAEVISLLAIDDNDFILLGMSHLRLDVKYKMEIAKSGKKGFEKYQENINKGLLYHALFIDIDMPEVSGLQLTTMIREFEKKVGITNQNQSCYIVGLITDENKDIEHYLEVGMNEFLNKPVHPKAMNEILARRLSKLKEIEEKLITQNSDFLPHEEPISPKQLNLHHNEEIITMLAVDDNDFILLGISHLKIRAGNVKFRMETSKSGKDAFEKYIKMTEKGLIYHSIFIDIEMPGMNGLELAQKIREFEKTKKIKPESLICGLITEDTTDIESYKQAGMDDFLNKPVNPGAMTKFLEERKLIV